MTQNCLSGYVYITICRSFSHWLIISHYLKSLTLQKGNVSSRFKVCQASLCCQVFMSIMVIPSVNWKSQNHCILLEFFFWILFLLFFLHLSLAAFKSSRFHQEWRFLFLSSFLPLFLYWNLKRMKEIWWYSPSFTSQDLGSDPTNWEY